MLVLDHCYHCLTPGSDEKPINALGLCPKCASYRRIRILYRPRPGDAPGWAEHLELLAERARQRLPLFPSQQ